MVPKGPVVVGATTGVDLAMRPVEAAAPLIRPWGVLPTQVTITAATATQSSQLSMIRRLVPPFPRQEYQRQLLPVLHQRALPL